MFMGLVLSKCRVLNNTMLAILTYANMPLSVECEQFINMAVLGLLTLHAGAPKQTHLFKVLQLPCGLCLVSCSVYVGRTSQLALCVLGGLVCPSRILPGLLGGWFRSPELHPPSWEDLPTCAVRP